MSSTSREDEAQKFLGQLQMKMIEIQTSLRKSTGQIEGLKREIQRAKLTDKEINTMKAETPMFSPVGRMFVLNSKNEIREQIEKKIKTCDDDIKKQEASKAYLEKQMRECESQFKERLAGATGAAAKKNRS
uniref:Prefoldin subunit 1 n=1 Tax=Philodina roseola TaxID=96448 RepID=B2ZFA1_PHIRO|nr:prefoldin subunit 1 [Philodina roseola]